MKKHTYELKVESDVFGLDILFDVIVMDFIK